MFYPKIVGGEIGNWTRKKYCSVQCFELDSNYFDDWEMELIRTYYPSEGWEYISRKTGRGRDAIQNKAYAMGITLNNDIYKKRVHDAAKEYMTENNPMFKQSVVDKVREYWETHPQEKEMVKQKVAKGSKKYQKGHPTKLEIRLQSFLDKLGIEYEPYAIIKKNFVVDIRIGTLVIEADGDYWHGHPSREPLTKRQKKQQARDKARNKYLTKCGYTVVRIWESDMSFEVVKNVLINHGIIKPHNTNNHNGIPYNQVHDLEV